MSEDCTYLKANPEVYQALKKAEHGKGAGAHMATLDQSASSDPFEGLIAELDLRDSRPERLFIAEQSASISELPDNEHDQPADKNVIVDSIPDVAFVASTDNHLIVIDTGCTNSMFKDDSHLSEVDKLPSPVAIRVGNGNKIWAEKAGTLNLGTIKVRVLVVPALSRNLLSGSQLARLAVNNKMPWSFGPKSCEFRLSANGPAVLSAPLCGRLWLLDPRTLPSACQPAALVADTSSTPLDRWHRCLGHANVDDIIRLGKEGRLGTPAYWKGQAGKDKNAFQCGLCIEGKGHRLPTHLSPIRASKPLELIHVDLFGPTPVQGLGGYRYFMCVYDDYTRRYHARCIRLKTAVIVANALKEYILESERRTKHKVVAMRSDQGSEFHGNDSHLVKAFLRSNGIAHQVTDPDSHTSNGRVQRANRTTMERARTCLFDSRLPPSYWPFAVNYAVYTLNRSPAGPEKHIPEEKWLGHEVRLDHIRPFGCELWVRDHKQTSKLKPRYLEGRLLGYVPYTHSCVVLLTGSRTITQSKDVIFAKYKQELRDDDVPAAPLAPQQPTMTDDDFDFPVLEPDQPAAARPVIEQPAIQQGEVPDQGERREDIPPP